MLNFLARCKKRAGLRGPDTNKKIPGRPREGGGTGGRGGEGGTISVEGGQYLLADYVRGGQFPLCPGGQNLRGDRICSDSGLLA